MRLWRKSNHLARLDEFTADWLTTPVGAALCASMLLDTPADVAARRSDSHREHPSPRKDNA